MGVEILAYATVLCIILAWIIELLGEFIQGRAQK